MWIRIEILAACGILLGVLVLTAICSIISSSRRKQSFARAIAERFNSDRDTWSSFPRVQSLLDSYLKVVALAGPGSPAAKSLRFNAQGDPLLGEEEKAALLIFNRMADIIDETWCSVHGKT